MPAYSGHKAQLELVAGERLAGYGLGDQVVRRDQPDGATMKGTAKLVMEGGAWKIGAIVSPLNPIYTDRELEEPLAIRPTSEALTALTSRISSRVGVPAALRQKKDGQAGDGGKAEDEHEQQLARLRVPGDQRLGRDRRGAILHRDHRGRLNRIQRGRQGDPARGRGGP